MNDSQKKMMVAWLNDAHAMALSFINNLEGKSKDAEQAHKLEVKYKIDENKAKLEEHVGLLESCISKIGGDPSLLKDTMGRTMGYVQGVMNSMYMDTMVKNALEMYAASQFAVGAYESLVAAADEMGDSETREVMARILEDDKKMAEWAYSQIPIATRNHLKENHA